MKRRTLARVSLLFLFPAALHADPVADENARLRQQVQDLQTRNAALERACPAAAQIPQSATPAAAAAAAIPTTEAPAPAVAAASPPVPPATPTAPLVHRPLQVFGPTAAPAPAAAADVPPPPPDYAKTGCDRGFFSGPAGGKWENSKAWKNLHAGMSQNEVEALLGVEHYNLSEPGSSALHWQYGRCNSGFEGEVLFVNGRVTSFTTP